MKIGITIGLNRDNESLWVNGIKLNILNLVKTLQQINEHDVYILDTSHTVKDLSKVKWDVTKYPIYKFNDKWQTTDIIIMLGTSLPTENIKKIRQYNPNIKVVKYQCGNNYVIDMERVIFNTVNNETEPAWDGSHDETWLIPQQAYQNLEYFQTIYRQEPHQVKIVPFIWDPEHLDNNTKMLSQLGKKTPGYIPNRPRHERKLSIMEPNLNVVKYSMIPLLIAETVYRNQGTRAFKQVYIGSGDKILKNDYYKKMIRGLDLVNYNPPMVKYVARYPITTFLAEETDIIISHQWENPLNYAYLDALYYNYPIIHNADFIKDAGYYYSGFSINEGASQLEAALSVHDPDQYQIKNKPILDRYLSTNPNIVSTYRKLIENLFSDSKLQFKYEINTNICTY